MLSKLNIFQSNFPLENVYYILTSFKSGLKKKKSYLVPGTIQMYIY